MVEIVLGILAFVLIAVLAVVEISNGMTIRRLKKVIDDLYFEVAQDRSTMYKDISINRDNVDILFAETKLLAARCNACEGCQCKKDSCEKESAPQKIKRPRLPKK